MDKVRVSPLRPREKRKWHRLKRRFTNAVNRRHARIVLLSRGGVRNREIATIECQFTALKEFALNNSDHRTHEELQGAIESYVQWRNGGRKLTRQSWREFKRQRQSAS